MFKELNLKTLRKCLITGVIMMLTGIILQVAKAQLFLKKEPPELGFMIGAVIAYTLVGFLFAIGFYVFRNTLPGRTVLQKSLLHSLLAIVTVLVPGILGMTAFDFEGGFDLLTSRKFEEYTIAIIDVINFLFGGLLLARLFRNDTVARESRRMPKGKLLGLLLGCTVFPLLMLTLFVTVQGMMSIGLDIPPKATSWFYTGFFAPLAITGAMLSVFYYHVKDTFSGSWLKKSLRFFLTFFICYWFMNISFMLVFGYQLLFIAILLLISIPPLLLITLLNGYIQKNEGVVPQ